MRKRPLHGHLARHGRIAGMAALDLACRDRRRSSEQMKMSLVASSDPSPVRTSGGSLAFITR